MFFMAGFERFLVNGVYIDLERGLLLVKDRLPTYTPEVRKGRNRQNYWRLLGGGTNTEDLIRVLEDRINFKLGFLPLSIDNTPFLKTRGNGPEQELNVYSMQFPPSRFKDKEGFTQLGCPYKFFDPYFAKTHDGVSPFTKRVLESREFENLVRQSGFVGG